jgi:hypothetical protein
MLLPKHLKQLLPAMRKDGLNPADTSTPKLKML